MNPIFTTREGNNPQDSIADWSDEQKLNEVLRFLSLYYFRNRDDSTHYLSGYITYTTLWEHLDRRSIFESECLSMVLYLSREHKIDITKSQIDPLETAPQFVRLNFEGHKFLHSGGYAQQKKDTENERLYKLNYDEKISGQSSNLTIATWAISIATCFLLIAEILSWTGCGH